MKKHLRELQIIITITILSVSAGIFMYDYLVNISDTKKEFQNKYNTAINKITSGQDYQGAIDILNELGDYQDSLMYIENANNWIKFEDAESLRTQGKYQDSLAAFKELEEIDNFEGKAEVNQNIKELESILEEMQNRKISYDTAVKYFESGNYLKALPLFKKLGDYEKSGKYAKSCETAVKILQNSTTISAGVVFSVGVTENEKVESSGNIILSQKDVDDWTGIVSISAFGSLVIGLKMDGTVITAGKLDNDYRIETGNWDDIIAVSAGDLYVVGLRENGTLVAQGYSGDGQMDIDDWTDIKAISTGWRHTVGLTNDGKIYIAGIRSKDEEIIENSPEWKDIVAISAGGGYPGIEGEQGHTVGLRKDKRVVAIGDNGKGQCNVEEWENIIAVSAGAFHTVGLTADGKVVTTQDDEDVLEDISTWDHIVAISAGYGTTFALREDGKVLSTGYEWQHQRDTDGWGKIATHEEEWKHIFCE